MRVAIQVAHRGSATVRVVCYRRLSIGDLIIRVFPL